MASHQHSAGSLNWWRAIWKRKDDAANEQGPSSQAWSYSSMMPFGNLFAFRSVPSEYLYGAYDFLIFLTFFVTVTLFTVHIKILHDIGPLALLILYPIFGIIAWAITETFSEMTEIKPLNTVVSFTNIRISNDSHLSLGFVYWLMHTFGFIAMSVVTRVVCEHNGITNSIAKGSLSILLPFIVTILNAFIVSSRWHWATIVSFLNRLSMWIAVGLLLLMPQNPPAVSPLLLPLLVLLNQAFPRILLSTWPNGSGFMKLQPTLLRTLDTLVTIACTMVVLIKNGSIDVGVLPTFQPETGGNSHLRFLNVKSTSQVGMNQLPKVEQTSRLGALLIFAIFNHAFNGVHVSSRILFSMLKNPPPAPRLPRPYVPPPQSLWSKYRWVIRWIGIVSSCILGSLISIVVLSKNRAEEITIEIIFSLTTASISASIVGIACVCWAFLQYDQSTLEPCVTTRAWFRWRAETNDLAPPIGHDGRPSRPQESSGNPPQFSGFQPYLGIIALIVCLVLLVLCSWSLDLTGPRLHSQIYAALLFPIGFMLVNSILVICRTLKTRNSGLTQPRIIIDVYEVPRPGCEV